MSIEDAAARIKFYIDQLKKQPTITGWDHDSIEALEMAFKILTGIHTDRPLVIMHSQILYLTEGHIDALLEYERKQMLDQLVNHMLGEADNE